MKSFLQECPDLAEYYQVMKTGRVPPTTIVGQSLLDILNEFADLKLKAVRSGQVKVPVVTATDECSSKEKDTIICAREQAEEGIKRQRSMWRDAKARQKKKARQQGTDTLVGDSVGSTTPISSCGDHVSTEDISVSTHGSVEICERTSIPASSEVTSPETKPTAASCHVISHEAMPAFASSHVTSPEYLTLSVPRQVGAPEIDSVSISNHVTNPRQTDTEHVSSAAAITEVEIMPDIQTDIPDLPRAQTGMNTQVQLVLPDKHSTGPSHEKIAGEENADLLDFLLEDTHFHEKLAENINKVLLECDPSQAKNKVGVLSIDNNKDLASMISKGFTINQIIERTESDPTFQNFLQLFQQGTAIPLCHFDVPIINIPSEVTTGQPGNTSLPTAGKPESSQAPHSCKNESVEPVNYQGDVSTVASACSVTFQPTNLSHGDSKQTLLLNPGDAEKLDEEVPCDTETMGISETPQVDSSPLLKPLETSSKDFTVTEKYGSQNLTDPHPSSSLQLVTSGFSENCSTSDLNCVQDLVISSESIENKKTRSKVQSSYIDADKCTAQNSVFLTNENSLTVFSLIEKSIAEMNGEEFIHRSKRNSPSSQTAGSIDTHSSGGNRNEGPEHLSTVVVCDNTSRSVIFCEDINNPVDNSERTEKCCSSNIQTGSSDIEKSVSISFNICSTQNTSAALTETAITKNVEAFQVGPAARTRTSDPDRQVVLCNTALPACDKSSELHPDHDNNSGENGLNPAALCQNDHIESRNKQHSTDIGGNSHVCSVAVSSSIGTDTSVNQGERHAAGQAVVGTREASVGVSGLKVLCIEPETSPILLKHSKKKKANSIQSPNKKNWDKSSNSVCEENNKQCSRSDGQNCTLVADGPVVRETDNMGDVETEAKKACLSEKELCVDNPEPFCMSPPLRKPGMLQPAMTPRHTKKTCVNTQTEVKRSQSLCDCSTSLTFLDEQITTADRDGSPAFKKYPVITSPPYLLLHLTDNNTDKQLSASLDPQTSCSSLPGNASLPGSPNFPQSRNSSIKQAPQMTPPQGKQLLTNSTTEDGQVQPKTVKRRVIAFHSEHSPFIPDHCKKNPSRRIVPKEVDYSTPSPLQDCPSSPMSYMVDGCVSQPNSPLNSKESAMRPLSSGKTLPPLNGHIKIHHQRSTEASCHNEKSSSCSAQSHTTEGQQKVDIPDVYFSHLDKLGIKLPPSPSRRKPRRINPVQLSSVNKDWSGVTRSSAFVPHGGYSPVVDESRIVSSTSDITTSSEEEAFRQLKSFLSSSYSKPQPRQEITSTDQKTGMPRSKSHNKHKGRGKKTSPVKENATTTSEANYSNMPMENVHAGSDYTTPKGASSLAESIPSCEDSVNKVCNTDSGSMKEQPTVSLSDSKGNLPVKSCVYKVQCLHNAAQPSVSPCSHDSDMSFAPVGIMECYPSEVDHHVQKINNCIMATASSSSSSLVTVCESTQNIPCLTESEGGCSKELRNTLSASGELCDYQNDIRGDAKVCAKTHKRQQMGAHSGLTIADVDEVSINCTSQAGAYGHCLPTGTISVEKPTNCMETKAADLVCNGTAYSNTPAIPTISIVANKSENKTCIHSTSMVKSLSSALSASDEHITKSADSPALENSDPSVSIGRHITQPQLESCGQHKRPDSSGSSPSAPAPNNVLNVTDSVTDAVYSLLSLCSSVDSKITTNIVSQADEKISSKVDTDAVLLTDKPSINSSKLSGQYPTTSVPVPLRSYLMPVPTMSSDVSLPSFISSSLRLAHNIELSCEVPTNCSSPIKHCNTHMARQDATINNENEQEVCINKERLRPGSPSSVSLLSRAMADSGIPFDGSDLTLPDTWDSAGEGVSHTLPVPPVRIPTPDVIAAVHAHMYSGIKKGRKPRPKAQKPDSKNVARILPNFGKQNFEFMEDHRVEDPALSGNFVKILPRASEAVVKPQVTDIQPQSSSLSQIQVIPSANGSIIIIPPGLEGIIQTLLSENNEPGPHISHMENNTPGPRILHMENNTTGPQASHTKGNLPVGSEWGKLKMISAKSLSTSCSKNILDLHTAMQTGHLRDQPHSENVGLEVAKKSRSCLRNKKLSSPSTNKLNQSSAGDLPSMTTAVEEDKYNSDSFSSSDDIPLSRISKSKCARKIAVRRRIDFTHLRKPKKGRKTKARKNKFKADVVPDCVSPGKQGQSSDVVAATDIMEGKSVSSKGSPRIKHTVQNLTFQDKKNYTDNAVRSGHTEAACEVERQSSQDCVVQKVMSDELCEINKLDSDFVQSDGCDRRKVSCGVEKIQNSCPSQSETAKSKTTVVCDNNKRNNNYAVWADKTSGVWEAKKSGTSDVVTSDKTSGVSEAKKSGTDGMVTSDKTSGVCEAKKSGTNDVVTSDKTSRVCDAKKSGTNDVVTSVKASGVCEAEKSGTNDVTSDKTPGMCEAKKSGTFDVVTSGKIPGVCEAKKNYTYNAVTSDKTHLVCDDITRSNNAGQKDKKGVCRVENSGINNFDRSNTADLEVEYNRGSQTVISCKITDTMAHNINKQGDHNMQDSEENIEKSSGDKRLHSGDQSEGISSNKDISSREGTKSNNISITAGKSAVPSLPALTKLTHDKSKSQMSRDLEDVILISDTEEISVHVDTSDQSAGISLHGHYSSVLSVKSSDVLKPSKNNTTVKAAQINKTQPAIINTVTDFSGNKTLSSLYSQNAMYVSGTNGSEMKSTHSKDTDSSEMKSTHSKDTDSSEMKSTHSKDTDSSEMKSTHSKSSDSSKVKPTHSEGISSSEVKYTHSKSSDSSKVKSTHSKSRKRRHKDADVDHPDSKKIKLQMLFDKPNITEHNRPDSVFKKIKLQMSCDQLDIRDHHICASQKSVRMVVDYRSGEKIVAANIPCGNSDVLITAELDEETLQSYSLQVNSQLKAKIKSPMKKNSSKTDKNVSITSTAVNKCTNEFGTAWPPGKKLETNNKISPKLGGCQYVGSVPVGSLFSLLDTVCLKGKQSTQPSFLPVNGSVSRSPKQPQHKCTDNPTSAVKNSHGNVTSSSTQTKYTAAPSGKAIPEHQKHRTVSDPSGPGTSRDRSSSQIRKYNDSTVSTSDIGKAIPEHQKHKTSYDLSVSGTSRDRSSSQIRKYNDSTVSTSDIGKAIPEHQKHKTVSDLSVSGTSRDRSSSQIRKCNDSTVSAGDIGKAIPEHQKHKTSYDLSVSGISRDRSFSQIRKYNDSTVSTGDIRKAIPEHQKHRTVSDPRGSGISRDRSSSQNRKYNDSTVFTGGIRKTIPEHQKHRTTDDPSGSGTSRDRSSSQNRKYNNSTVSSGNVGKGKRPDFQTKQETSNGGKEADTASVVDVDYVSDSGYDNETQDAVSALELCMRETADEHTHHFHNQPGPLCVVSSQHHIDHSAVAILEDLMCQMSNTSADAKKLQPCDLNDTSPIKLHLPPKKRLSSEFIVNGTVGAKFCHDQTSSVLPASDSVLSLNKEEASQSHSSSVEPSKHLQDSSEPATVTVSAYIETGAVHYKPLTQNVLLSNQPAALYHTSQTDTLATEVRGKMSPIPLSHEEVIALSEELSVQMLQQSLSTKDNLVNTSSFCEIGKEQSPLSSCALGEQHKHRQSSCSSSVASPDRINPNQHGYSAAVCEPALKLSPVNKHEPCAVSEKSEPDLKLSPVNKHEPCAALETACISSAYPTQRDEIHPISQLAVKSKIDKLLRKLHKKNKTQHL